MINCESFFHLLKNKEVEFFAGVPDSLLKDLNAFITDNIYERNNITAANEGGAIALATGYHLATGKIPVVYMQNSGQGNAVNPLTSLADKEVYSIPMLLIIGWRGEPGVHDEPQHVKQGKITLKLLETLGIHHEILPDNLEEAKETLERLFNSIKETNSPHALVVKKGTFETYKLKKEMQTNQELSREEALQILVNNLTPSDVIVSTTGMLSRELFEYREFLKQGHEKDFLTVGSMGHASQIALGIALQKPHRQIYCLDGDGAAIMHLGSIAIIGSQRPINFKHVILNNGAHDSVGGQPTAGFRIDIPNIAKACGYKNVWRTETRESLQEKIKLFSSSEGPSLLEVFVKKGARSNLGRPTISPVENKKDFMENLKI